MAQDSDRLAEYLAHLKARVRQDRLARLSDDLTAFCRSNPRECLEFVVRALEQTESPQLIRAVGDELLENLLNESSGVIHEEVLHHLRTNQRFRQAFASGDHPSVDPALIAEWVKVFQDLGTTKRAERKSLWKRAAENPSA